MRQELVRLEHRLAVHVAIGHHEELVGLDLALALRARRRGSVRRRRRAAPPGSTGARCGTVPSPKIAWNWFSPSTAKQRGPPFLRQGNSSLRKYQQRGRCMRLPPTVPTLRICGVPTSPAACGQRGIRLRERLVRGDIREPRRRADASSAPGPATVIVAGSAFTFTSALGLRDVVLHQRRAGPCRRRAAAPCRARSRAPRRASFSFVALT